MAGYKAENITKGGIQAAGDNAGYYHRTAMAVRKRGQQGHETWEAESQASLANLALMRSSLLKAAHEYTARWQASPANETTAKLVEKYMALVEQADTYLGAQ